MIPEDRTFPRMYLIQRCTLEEGVVPKPGKRFNENVRLDYMGSAEFEWGILPASLREMGKEGYGIVKLKSIRDEKGRPLCVYSNLNMLEIPLYEEQLKALRAGSLDHQLKERSHFAQRRSDYQLPDWETTNVWWDCENHVIWTFELKLANVLRKSILTSVAWMHSMKDKKAA